MANSASNYIKSIPSALMNSVSDVLSNSDFVSRSIGMNNSYDDLTLLVQSLGHAPVSLLGKDFPFIFDHVRRIYQQGTYVPSFMYGGIMGNCPKFTFYKEKPTIRFADPIFDHENLLERWMPDIKLNTSRRDRTEIHYAESNDDEINNKSIQNAEGNLGTANGQNVSSFSDLSSCDIIKKTNDGFNFGKYRTLIARFHTNSEDSKEQDNPTQTANTKKYGMSHGRNLLKVDPKPENGYNNPYCRVWTYHHQYNQMDRAIRPFGDAHSAEELDKKMFGEDNTKGGFRTIKSTNYGFDGGSKRLDDYGVLNYENGFVNIAPTAKIKDYFEHKEDDKDNRSVPIKRCMFSLENLAWRDEKNRLDEFDAYGLSAEQKGPLGGRIMWFPPYNLKFNETVRANWNHNDFIGRGEKVYTYTNTERTGTLSFTLLIDHPSILDYWTGHERNGMNNRGVPLSPGNDGGVDNVNNQENTLLRFFAGCEILSAKPQEYWVRNKKPKVVPTPPSVPNPNPTEPEEVKKTENKVLYCLVYYPNNYSGVDDTPNGSNPTVNAIHYLLNGIGTQKRVSYITNDAIDFAVDMAVKPTIPSVTGNYGGYEMRPNGISVADGVLSSDYEVIKSTYADIQSKERKAQYLTTPDGSKIGAYYGTTAPFDSLYLAKQIGSEAASLSYAKEARYTKKSPYEWYRKRWYYRVDKDTENQKLTLKDATSGQINYLDTASFQYNSVGYNSRTDKLQSEFGISITGDNKTLVSLTDMYMALEGEGKSNDLFSGMYDQNNVDIINKIREKDGTCKITKITFYGHASVQGNNPSERVNSERNNKLAKNRALTFKKWLEKNNFPGLEDAQIQFKNGVQSSGNKNDVNDPITKLWRSASVVIEYEETTTEPAQKKDTSTQLDASGNTIPSEDGKGYLDQVNTISNQNKSQEVSPGRINTARDWLHNTEEGRRILQTGYTETQYQRMPDGSIMKVEVPKMVDENTFTMADAARITGKDYLNTASTEYDDSYKKEGITVGKSDVKRYDNEGEFFQLLERNAPFMHHLITDKIKYFDPAYHSISPEGFNARLTFLQQCCRQGPTVGQSDYYALTAYNLAFGRPPVCVLRLGDFYYTKIIIDSIQIQYDEATWDLNPEGIGVMPMFANISLSFAFIGGSDLAGPISRLQNAVSFNYYANTSVYDNRAEKVLYSNKGDGREVKYKPFVYPNTNYGAGVDLNRTGTTDSDGIKYAEDF